VRPLESARRFSILHEICHYLGHIVIRLLLLSLVIGSVFTGAVDAAPTLPEQKRVLVVHSTRRDSLVSEAAERVVARRLETSLGERLD
jgi:hypothetical protein